MVQLRANASLVSSLAHKTGINDAVVSSAKPLDIYTISGLKVNTKSTDKLPAGVYIINGKKKIIK